MMAALLASGRLIDIALAFVAVELAVVLGHFWRTGRGIRPADLLSNLASGVCLMLALRCGVTGAPWPWVAAFLVAALAAHLSDVRRRWR